MNLGKHAVAEMGSWAHGNERSTHYFVLMLLYLAVSNFRGVILSELSIRAGETFKNIVHSLLASGSLPAEDALVSYNAGECVLCFAGLLWVCFRVHGAVFPCMQVQISFTC